MVYVLHEKAVDKVRSIGTTSYKYMYISTFDAYIWKLYNSTSLWTMIAVRKELIQLERLDETYNIHKWKH